MLRPMIKQSTFLRKVLKAAQAEGWTITRASNGEDAINTNGVERAIRKTQECDEGAIRLVHIGNDQRVTLQIVWQGPDATYPNGEEIISDFSGNDDAALDAFDAIWAKCLQQVGA